MKKLLKIFALFLIIFINSCAKSEFNREAKYKNDSRECDRCNGTGKILCDYCIKSNPEKCPLCHKTYGRRCPSCEGTGKIVGDSEDEKNYDSDSSDN